MAVDSGLVLPEPYTPASVIPSVEEEPLTPTPPTTPTTNQLSVADRVSKLYATKKKSKEVSTGIATNSIYSLFCSGNFDTFRLNLPTRKVSQIHRKK